MDSCVAIILVRQLDIGWVKLYRPESFYWFSSPIYFVAFYKNSLDNCCHPNSSYTDRLNFSTYWFDKNFSRPNVQLQPIVKNRAKVIPCDYMYFHCTIMWQFTSTEVCRKETKCTNSLVNATFGLWKKSC